MEQLPAEATLARLDDAHRILLRQADLQFHPTPVPQPVPPPWLVWLVQHLGPVVRRMGGAAPYVFWPMLAIGVIAVLYPVAQHLIGVKPASRGAGVRLTAAEPDWRPEPAKARLLLEDADRLAAQGLFVEAAHLILLRSIEDIRTRNPRMLTPALTSRDIARLPELPPRAKETFAGIARAVELSLFGGQPLDRDGFDRCRRAYQDFAGKDAWA